MEFERYATERLPVLIGTARAVCGDPRLAEDLVQDVLIKAHQRWSHIRELDAPDAYVRRMLVNEFLSWRRRWARIVPRADLPDTSTPDPAVAHAERDALLGELRELPRRQRLVVAMRYLADLTDAEIADALGCSEGTVRAHASRALATLRVRHTVKTPEDHR